jgi:DNA-binding IclR family transcriptional regulator
LERHRTSVSVVAKLGGSELTPVSLWHAAMLARSTRETVWIGELLGGDVHIVHQTVRPGDLVQALGGSGTLPWHACGLGYAIVAGLDDPARSDLLAVPARRLTGLTPRVRDIPVPPRHRPTDDSPPLDEARAHLSSREQPIRAPHRY